MSSGKRIATGPGSFGSKGRAGPGFGPGAANPADPELRLMDRQAEPRLRPRILPDAISRASVHENADGREEGREFLIRQAANRQGFGPDGEPAGTPERASAPDGLREMRGRDLSW